MATGNKACDQNSGGTAKSKSGSDYKDKLFRVLFKDNQRAIELCNALEGTSYPPDAEVKVCGLVDSLAARYNDSAVVVEDELLVFSEHQSTIFPNMPLRFLSYVTDTLFGQIVDTKELYGTKRHIIPTPKFYVLYNGEAKLNSDTIKLSEAFRVPSDTNTVEITVKVIDVNYHNGNEVLQKSPSLGGYAYLVSLIRQNINTGIKRDRAIGSAMKQCISEGVLADFLKENFEEVVRMLLWEYDKETEIAIKSRDARSEGKGEGKAEGKAETAIAMLKDGIPVDKVAMYTNMSVEWVNNLMVGA